MAIFAKILRLTRYFIFLSFRGTSYHGWQVQPNSVTVQKIIEDGLTKVIGEKISVTGAGRTDTGVHALVFCAHFDSSKSNLAEHKNLIFRLNRFLPDDIAVTSVRKVIDDANARFSAISRTYRYYISNTKDPFDLESSWMVYGYLDIASMNKACEILRKHSDFTSFSRLHSDNKTNLCKVFNASWVQVKDKVVFTITADRFLRNMVRAIVGTMIEIGKGKLDPESVERILISKNRSSAGMSAPAKGLFLEAIEYPEEIFV